MFAEGVFPCEIVNTPYYMCLQCRHLIPALNVWAARAKYTTARPISTHFSLALMHV